MEKNFMEAVELSFNRGIGEFGKQVAKMNTLAEQEKAQAIQKNAPNITVENIVVDEQENEIASVKNINAPEKDDKDEGIEF